MITRTHRNGSSDMPRPSQGGPTTVRHIRLGDEIWEPVQQAAAEDGVSATDIVKTALAEYMAKRARQRRAQKTKEQTGE